MFQVLSHFERCPGFDKKRYVKKIAGGVFNALQFYMVVGYANDLISLSMNITGSFGNKRKIIKH